MDGTRTVGIAHADCPDGALRLQAKLRDAGQTGEILSVCYEPVTGGHVGPGTVALFFFGVVWRYGRIFCAGEVASGTIIGII